MDLKKISINKSYLISLIGMLIWFTYSLFWGERIAIGYGLGSDGSIYGGWAQTDTLELLRSKTIGIYHSTRILPSIIVHYIAQFFNYPLGDLTHPEGVIKAFLVFNCFLIVGCTILLYLIAEHLGWKPQLLMLGFVMLIVNFPILNLSNYNPTLTDFAAFFFGMLIFYLYLTGRQLELFLVAILASFTWPTTLYTSIPLLVFQAKKLKFLAHTPTRLSILISALIGGMLVLGTLYVFYINGLRLPHGATPVNENFIILSAFCFFGYISIMLSPLIDIT